MSKMKKITMIEFISCLSACILGVIFHFVYHWSNRLFVIGLFFPINESIWEHLKLIFFPIMIVSLIEYSVILSYIDKHLVSKNTSLASPHYPYLICIKLKSAIVGMQSTVILYYTLNGMFGRTPDFVNIFIYFISMSIAYFYSNTQIKSDLANTETDSCEINTFQFINRFQWYIL